MRNTYHEYFNGRSHVYTGPKGRRILLTNDGVTTAGMQVHDNSNELLIWTVIINNFAKYSIQYCAFAEPELLSYRKPKLVFQNEMNGH